MINMIKILLKILMILLVLLIFYILWIFMFSDFWDKNFDKWFNDSVRNFATKIDNISSQDWNLNLPF